MFVLFQLGIFDAAQITQIAAALVAIISAIGLLAPIYQTYLSLKINKRIHEMAKTQQVNTEKLHELGNRPRHRATDDAPVEAVNLPPVPPTDLD